MITITRKHTICAGHRVFGQGGKCEQLHGHQYRFHMTCTANELNDVGMILDFGEIKKRLCRWLDENWDHRFLIWDEDPWSKPLAQIDPKVVWVPFNPTAENIAEYIVREIGPAVLEGTGVTLIDCKVDETENCSASYYSYVAPLPATVIKSTRA